MLHTKAGKHYPEPRSFFHTSLITVGSTLTFHHAHLKSIRNLPNRYHHIPPTTDQCTSHSTPSNLFVLDPHHSCSLVLTDEGSGLLDCEIEAVDL